MCLQLKISLLQLLEVLAVISVSLVASLLLVITIFFSLRQRYSLGETMLSPLFYFAVLWWLAFPLHAYLLDAAWVDTQQPVAVSQRDLAAAVWLSVACMLLVWRGAATGSERLRSDVSQMQRQEKIGWMSFMMALLISLALIFLCQIVIQFGSLSPFVGNQQNLSRVGSGPLFMLSELFIFGLIAIIPAIVQPHARWSSRLPLLVLFVLGLILAVFMGIALTSRRIMVLPLFALALAWLFMQARVSRTLSTMLLLVTFLAVPSLQQFRYMFAPAVFDVTASVDSEASDQVSAKTTAAYCRFFNDRPIPQRAVVILDDFGKERSPAEFQRNVAASFCDGQYKAWFSLQTLATSYGLVDHLATFLDKATPMEIIAGVDQGRAWLFNAGLALIPRAIWTDKPMHYGSVAEQKWLYPGMYANDQVTTALPPSFILDFMFGFGVLSLVALCYGLGRLLHWTHRVLLEEKQVHNHARFAFGLFIMSYMFNIVRGGTGFLQLVLYMAVILVLMYGGSQLKYFFFMRKRA